MRTTGLLVASFGPAVISRIGSKPGDYYENTYFGSESLLSTVPRIASGELTWKDFRTEIACVLKEFAIREAGGSLS